MLSFNHVLNLVFPSLPMQCVNMTAKNVQAMKITDPQLIDSMLFVYLFHLIISKYNFHLISGIGNGALFQKAIIGTILKVRSSTTHRPSPMTPQFYINI